MPVTPVASSQRSRPFVDTLLKLEECYPQVERALHAAAAVVATPAAGSTPSMADTAAASSSLHPFGSPHPPPPPAASSAAVAAVAASHTESKLESPTMEATPSSSTLAASTTPSSTTSVAVSSPPSNSLSEVPSPPATSPAPAAVSSAEHHGEGASGATASATSLLQATQASALPTGAQAGILLQAPEAAVAALADSGPCDLQVGLPAAVQAPFALPAPMLSLCQRIVQRCMQQTTRKRSMMDSWTQTKRSRAHPSSCFGFWLMLLLLFVSVLSGHNWDWAKKPFHTVLQAECGFAEKLLSSSSFCSGLAKAMPEKAVTELAKAEPVMALPVMAVVQLEKALPVFDGGEHIVPFPQVGESEKAVPVKANCKLVQAMFLWQRQVPGMRGGSTANTPNIPDSSGSLSPDSPGPTPGPLITPFPSPYISSPPTLPSPTTRSSTPAAQPILSGPHTKLHRGGLI
jgi:hypothetical protein